MPWPKRANNSWVYGGFARSDERNKRKGSDSKRKNDREKKKGTITTPKKSGVPPPRVSHT